MPFPNQTSRAFTHAAIETLYPGQMGVYGLFNQREWIYIGSGDIRQRLLDHLNGNTPCITSCKPTHWAGVVTDAYVAEEKRLILEYCPVCNQRVG